MPSTGEASVPDLGSDSAHMILDFAAIRHTIDGKKSCIVSEELLGRRGDGPSDYWLQRGEPTIFGGRNGGSQPEAPFQKEHHASHYAPGGYCRLGR